MGFNWGADTLIVPSGRRTGTATVAAGFVSRVGISDVLGSGSAAGAFGSGFAGIVSIRPGSTTGAVTGFVTGAGTTMGAGLPFTAGAGTLCVPVGQGTDPQGTFLRTV